MGLDGRAQDWKGKEDGCQTRVPAFRLSSRWTGVECSSWVSFPFWSWSLVLPNSRPAVWNELRTTNALVGYVPSYQCLTSVPMTARRGLSSISLSKFLNPANSSYNFYIVRIRTEVSHLPSRNGNCPTPLLSLVVFFCLLSCLSSQLLVIDQLLTLQQQTTSSRWLLLLRRPRASALLSFLSMTRLACSTWPRVSSNRMFEFLLLEEHPG